MSRAAETRERILETAEALALRKGFSAMSLADIVAETQLTKGAFFHHFRGKAELAQELVERFARRDIDLFAEFAERARALADNPLQAVSIYLKLFEEFMADPVAAPDGCVFASFLYEREQFAMPVTDAVRIGLADWTAIHEDVFQALIDYRKPCLSVTAQELAEMFGVIIEGSFVYGRAYGDRSCVARQTRRFRQYLTLLFGEG
jgi:TetR/AcrR family transcriptional repressor of nem operon